MPSNSKKTGIKVGLVIDTSIDLTDGVQQYVKTLCSALKKLGVRVEIITGSSGKQEINGVKIHSLAKSVTLKFNSNTVNIPLWASRRRIQRFWSENNFDLLHIQAPYSPLLAGKIISHAPKEVAIVATFHILPTGKLEAWGSRLLNITYARSRRRINEVISVSQPARVFTRKYFGFDSQVVPNTISIADFCPANGLLSVTKQRNVVFLGRLDKRKGAKELILAYYYLPISTKLKHKLLIAGDGPQRDYLVGLSRKLNIQEIKFLGYIPENEKANLLSRARVACFPSLFGESFGIVLLEAMAAGSGVVLAGSNPGYKSVMAAMQEQIVEPKNTQEFTTKLNRYLSDDKIAQSAQARQSEYVEQFSSDMVAKRIITVYYSAIDKLSKKRHTN